ncbi:MbnP family protein [Solirubrum puertoriconensis]|uniref:Copper-binding protein MbnP-like domain-containing protein n=1 Tax=Solirubrum puertoriconensis TaxID=1751427 RepID=A0A9X0HPA8_SOLP1|nr:MbnP family protein [Solirubrum puertoriconensis]KUG09782.1 hypothetical protein ASU33_19100 [Solirubrum puertoriconensis]
MLFRTLSSALLALLLGIATLSFTACDDDDKAQPNKGELDLEFENVVGTQALTLGQAYTSTNGDAFTLSKLNYYISNIKLTKADGSEWAEPESYHLVKHDQTSTRTFTLQEVPTGDYTKITFTIGVDSTRNVSGAQTGALDPLNDMFWTWNSGYIFLKLEGTSPQAANGQLVFHIGGFKSPNNTIRSVSPPLPQGTVLKVRAEKAPAVHYKADVLKLFTGPNVIRFAELSNTMGGPSSVKVANNYAAGMFRIDHVHAD